MTPLERLLALTDVADQHAPPEVAEWLGQAVRRYLDDGQGLEVALNLQGSPYSYRRQQRNQHLVAAWLALPGDLSDWGRSRELVKRIQHFEAITWPRLKFSSIPPIKPIDRHLFHALKTGASMPSTPKQIQRIVDSDRSSNVQQAA